MLIAKRSNFSSEIPDGVWVGTITGVKDRGLCDFGYGERNYFDLVYTVNVNGKQLQFSELFQLNFDLKSNLFKRAFSLLGVDPGSEFNVETLIGITRTFVIQNVPDKKGTLRPRIQAVLPANQPATAAPAQPAATAAPAAQPTPAAPVQDRAQFVVDQINAARNL